jgi:hypothetical protein
MEIENDAIQMTTIMLNIIDSYGGYGDITMGQFLNMYTSSSTEYYGLGFSPLATGTISSFSMVRSDGITTPMMSPLYISSLHLGNFGGTTAGQLTTDDTATDLFWNGSKLNNQSGGGGGGGGAIDYVSAFTVSTSYLTVSTIALGDDARGLLTTDNTATDLFWNGSKLNNQSGGGGGGGGAIDYVSAFTVSTNYINTSTLSSYVIECYGILGTAMVNQGPDNMNFFSLTDMYFTGLSNFNLSKAPSIFTTFSFNL